jgi:glucose/arabinose dehydrogenase
LETQFLEYLYLVRAFCVLLVSLGLHYSVSYGSEGSEGLLINDENLMAEKVTDGLDSPTTFAFIGPNDILVLEKDKGTVLRILDGKVLPEPVLDVNVANQVEQGLLGIAVSKNFSDTKTYVFLYYTEAEAGAVGAEDDENDGEEQTSNGDGGQPLGNRLYRYELSEDGARLINPKLLLDLPYQPGPAHNGGVVAIGPDNNVYVMVGNLLANAEERFEGDSLDQNIKDGRAADGRGGILRVSQDGQIVNGKGILGDEHPLDMYYAYGIRNGFGIAFDPMTGNLWDTENGGNFDEINLVEPGFNSGWEKVMGKASLMEGFDQNDLVDFNGNGKYSDPEFSWSTGSNFRTAPTSIVFFDSDKLGRKYENGIFVGDVHGKIYNFALDRDRIKLILNGLLADEVADDLSELEDILFAEFPGIITDLKVGPDGYLYVLLYQQSDQEGGGLFRIVPSNT